MRRSQRQVNARALTVILALAAATPLPAQSSISAPLSSCVAELPDSVLTRVPVYLEAEPRDSAGKVILPLVDLLTRIVAYHVRTSLGAGRAELPRGEPTVTWRNIGPGVVVSAHRDGRISWSLPFATSNGERRIPTGVQLLDRALTAVRDSGEQIFVPQETKRDSLTFRLAYRHPSINRNRALIPIKARSAIPVFSLAIPWEEPAGVLRPPRPRYPPRPRSGFAEGVVHLQFMIDTLGRPEMSTVREWWPEARPRPAGELGEYYRAFVAAAKRSIADARYEPARFGGCAARQFVDQPFSFELRY